MKKLFLFLLFLEIAHASSIGVLEQSATITVLKGVETQTYITLINPNEKEVIVSMRSNKEWVLNNEEIKIPTKKSKKIPIRVLVPANTQNGIYESILLATVQQDKKDVQVTPAIGLPFTIFVTGEERVELDLVSVETSNGEVGMPLTFYVQVQNKGTVLLKPVIKISISEKGEEIEQKEQQTILLPGETKTELLHWTPEEEGTYTGEVTIGIPGRASIKKEITFTVQSQRYFSRSGNLESFFLNTTPEKNKPLKITGVFANNGTLPVDAKLIAEVYHEGKLEKVVESEKSIVDQTETKDLAAYFTPTENKKYTITGKVVYAGKETSKKYITVDVFSPIVFFQSGTMTVILIAIFLVCITGLGYIGWKWKKEKQEEST